MHYNSSVLEAFNSVEHIMRDVNNGWLIRYLHSNTASAFFFLVYLHIGRGLYYGSYKAPRTLVWTIGTVIFILMIATAFLGYKCSPKWSYLEKLDLKILYKKNNFRLSQKRYSSSISLYKGGINHNSERLNNFLKEKKLYPVVSYENIDSDITRKTIILETKGLSGIYLILNKVTLDYYVGSASTDRLYARFSNHLIYFRGSKILKHAVRKYKLSSFAFLVLELFPEVVTKENNKQLIDREDFYLKTLLPNYNILTEAGSTFGYKHTEMDRLKMKTNYSQARRLQIGNLNKGKKLSDETIEKFMAKRLIAPKSFISEQALLNMKKISKPIRLYNLDRTVYGEYPSILATANSVNCGEKTVIRALATNKKILKRRYIVEVINKVI